MSENLILSPQEIEHIANLSRIELREGDRQKFASQLGVILQYVHTLSCANTDDIDPSFMAMSLSNVFRKDEPVASLGVEEALSNAPLREDNYFRMPRILNVEDAS